jgi:hypothetical protein
LAVAAGPKRTAPAIDAAKTDNLLVKAAVYRAKANATTDADLAKGWLIMADEYAKAASSDISK